MEDTRQFIYDIIRKFKVNIEKNIPEKPFSFEIRNASTVIRNNIDGTIQQLCKEGILKDVKGSYKLTQQGFIKIYGNSEEQMQFVRNFIIDLAKELNLKKGGFLELRSIIQNTNPVIINNWNAVLEQLFCEGLFEKINDLPRLTEQGFNEIYGA